MSKNSLDKYLSGLIKEKTVERTDARHPIYFIPEELKDELKIEVNGLTPEEQVKELKTKAEIYRDLYIKSLHVIAEASDDET